jgi:uncharacterized protein involved in tolerance to divalent cations
MIPSVEKFRKSNIYSCLWAVAQIFSHYLWQMQRRLATEVHQVIKSFSSDICPYVGPSKTRESPKE